MGSPLKIAIYNLGCRVNAYESFALADIARALETVHAVSAYGGGMTGSGSACYAVFAEEAACLAARASCPKDMTALCVPTVPQK